MLGVFLFVQFVAFFGARLFGCRRRASRRLARRCLPGSPCGRVVVIIAFFVPAKSIALFFALGLLIGIVLGGTQALSRSLYSQLIPRGKEAEFFSLYQAMERGTSWLGTLAFGLVYQFTHSYRWAIIVLIFFFVVGGLLLAKVRHAPRHRGGRQPGPGRSSDIRSREQRNRLARSSVCEGRYLLGTGHEQTSWEGF